MTIQGNRIREFHYYLTEIVEMIDGLREDNVEGDIDFSDDGEEGANFLHLKDSLRKALSYVDTLVERVERPIIDDLMNAVI